MSDVSASAPAAKSAPRYLCVDALRGFDMFWIVGADHLAEALGDIAKKQAAANPGGAISSGGFSEFISTQLRHVGWEGFHFYDLIFPLFIFMLGMSTVFSLPKYLEEHGKAAAHARLFRRFIMLFLLGAFYDSGISDLDGESPFSGVLQRMSWCYLFTALCFINLKLRGQLIVFFSILIGYWALLTFVPMPGEPAVTFEHNRNIVNYFDHVYLPLKEDGQFSDPEGLLSTIPAVATGLLGLFAGLVMTKKRLSDKQRLGIYVGAGLGLLLAGFLLSYQTPIIKKIWTSSYVLVAGGYSCLLLAAFYYVVDMLELRKWATPFFWIGANPLLIYLSSEFLDFHNMAERLIGGPVAKGIGTYGEVCVSALGIVLIVIYARFLYQRKIFLRV